jgi:hypothetical protein
MTRAQILFHEDRYFRWKGGSQFHCSHFTRFSHLSQSRCQLPFTYAEEFVEDDPKYAGMGRIVFFPEDGGRIFL